MKYEEEREMWKGGSGRGGHWEMRIHSTAETKSSGFEGSQALLISPSDKYNFKYSKISGNLTFLGSEQAKEVEHDLNCV